MPGNTRNIGNFRIHGFWWSWIIYMSLPLARTQAYKQGDNGVLAGGFLVVEEDVNLQSIPHCNN